MESTLGRSILNSLSIKQREEITKYFEELYGITPKESNTVSAEEFLENKGLDKHSLYWKNEERHNNNLVELLQEYKENNNWISVENPPKQKQ